MAKKIVRTFYEKELQKANQKEFGVEIVIERKGDKLFVKRKGYNISFNSWIDKKKTEYKWVNVFQNRNLHDEE